MYAFTYIAVLAIWTCYFLSECRELQRDVCLQRALEFIYWDNACYFLRDGADRFLSGDKYTCTRKCRVRIANLKNGWNSLLQFIIMFDEKSITYNYGCNGYFPQAYLNISCSSLKEGNVLVDGPCASAEQCSGYPYSSVCSDTGRCVCKTGYIQIQHDCYEGSVLLGGNCDFSQQCSGSPTSVVCSNAGKCVCTTGFFSIQEYCVEGNVSLDSPCTFHAQCSGHPYTSCINGTCSCLNGYVAENSSSCILHLPGSVKAEIIGNQQGSGLGTMLGALFGGVLLGVLITTGIVFVIYKRIQPNANKRQTVETRVVFADNNANGNARIERNVDNASRDITKQRKVVNVPPYTPSDESVEYSNVPKTSRRKLTNEDVYNHLNEKEERDDDDYYDHASAATGHVRDMSNYSSMHDMEKGSGSTAAKGTDNYFTLEQS